MRIWTEAYRPFIMGGDVNAPVACDVPVDGPFDLGKEIEGYLAVAPNGTTFVAEGVTGAIVGATIGAVRNDVMIADLDVIQQQLECAKERSAQATTVSVSLFWRLLRSN